MPSSFSWRRWLPRVLYSRRELVWMLLLLTGLLLFATRSYASAAHLNCEIRVEKDTTICAGQYFETVSPTQDTTIMETFTTAENCDSIVTTHIYLRDPKVQIEGDSFICTYEVSTLQAPPGFATYQWSTGDSSRTIEADENRQYRLTVTDFSGCRAVDSFSLEVQYMRALIDADPPDCSGMDNARINDIEVTGGSGHYQYRLGRSDFQDSPKFEGMSDGAFSVAVRDVETGCIYDQILVLERPDIIVLNMGEDQQIEPGDSVRIGPNIARPFKIIKWTPSDGLSCDDCLNPMASPAGTTTYELYLLDLYRCEAKGKVTVFVQQDIFLYAPNAFSPNGDGINDTFTLYTAPGIVRQIDRLAVFDRWGNLVFEGTAFPPNDDQAGWDGTRRGTPCPPGVYAFFAEVSNGLGGKKIIEGEILLVR